MHRTISAAARALVLTVAFAAASAGAAGVSKMSLQVLSSPAQYVTGGDARIAITAPAVVHSRLTLLLNGQPIAPNLVSTGNRLEGVISGLRTGANSLLVRHISSDRTIPSGTAAIVLTKYLITGPVFSTSSAPPRQSPTAGC